ncbi:MAG: dihydrolipoyl dehydrogenase [Nitrospirota bacterium]
MEKLHYDLVILGGGPGGYVAAIRAGQLGMKTALIEKEEVGGVCLHHGCIPSKVFLKSAEVLSIIKHAAEFGIKVGEIQPDFSLVAARSEKIMKRLHRGITHLLKKNKVDVYAGVGRFLSPKTIHVLGEFGGELTIDANHIIIATGSQAQGWPNLKTDGVRVITSDHALKQETLPRSIVIIGGGAVGVELASFYSTFGVVVMIIEVAPALLPKEDQEISILLKRNFEKRGIVVLTSTRIQKIEDSGSDFTIILEGISNPIVADIILVATGRTPNTHELNLNEAGVIVTDTNCAISVNNKMQTSQEGIFAIGDVTTRPALAHGAMEQGVYVVETIAGIEREPIDLNDIPNAIYCYPEVASVGLTEEAAKAEGLQVKIAKYPLSANARAVILNETDGFVKLISDVGGHILGAHLIGSEVTELIAEVMLIKTLKGRALDIKRAIHPHPTLSEAIMEAAGLLTGQAIHL